jgi:hypothetical protein
VLLLGQHNVVLVAAHEESLIMQQDDVDLRMHIRELRDRKGHVCDADICDICLDNWPCPGVLERGLLIRRRCAACVSQKRGRLPCRPSTVLRALGCLALAAAVLVLWWQIVFGRSAGLLSTCCADESKWLPRGAGVICPEAGGSDSECVVHVAYPRDGVESAVQCCAACQSWNRKILREHLNELDRVDADRRAKLQGELPLCRIWQWTQAEHDNSHCSLKDVRDCGTGEDCMHQVQAPTLTSGRMPLDVCSGEPKRRHYSQEVFLEVLTRLGLGGSAESGEPSAGALLAEFRKKKREEEEAMEQSTQALQAEQEVEGHAQPASNKGMVEELQMLAALHGDGLLTEAEFTHAKTEVLKRHAATKPAVATAAGAAAAAMEAAAAAGGGQGVFEVAKQNLGNLLKAEPVQTPANIAAAVVQVSDPYVLLGVGAAVAQQPSTMREKICADIPARRVVVRPFGGAANTSTLSSEPAKPSRQAKPSVLSDRLNHSHGRMGPAGQAAPARAVAEAPCGVAGAMWRPCGVVGPAGTIPASGGGDASVVARAAVAEQRDRSRLYFLAGGTVPSMRPTPLLDAVWFESPGAQEEPSPPHPAADGGSVSAAERSGGLGRAIALQHRLKRKLTHNYDVLLALEFLHRERCFDEKVVVWIEDDVRLCAGADRHLEYIAGWLQNQTKIKYARTSFGFNGVVIRCAALPEMIKVLRRERCRAGFDDTLHTTFNAKGAVVYQLNLFSHDDGKVSTLELDADAQAKRHARVPRCYNMLINPLSGTGFDYPSCKGQAFCPRQLPASSADPLHPWETAKENPVLPATLARDAIIVEPGTNALVVERGAAFYAAANLSAVLGRRADDCHDACMRRGMACRPAMMRLVNTFDFLEHHFTTNFFEGTGEVLAHRAEPCQALKYAVVSDGPDQPMLFKSGRKGIGGGIVCLLKQVEFPTCEGRPKDNWYRRICGCDAGSHVAHRHIAPVSKPEPVGHFKPQNSDQAGDLSAVMTILLIVSLPMVYLCIQMSNDWDCCGPELLADHVRNLACSRCKQRPPKPEAEQDFWHREFTVRQFQIGGKTMNPYKGRKSKTTGVAGPVRRLRGLLFVGREGLWLEHRGASRWMTPWMHIKSFSHDNKGLVTFDSSQADHLSCCCGATLTAGTHQNTRQDRLDGQRVLAVVIQMATALAREQKARSTDPCNLTTELRYKAVRKAQLRVECAPDSDKTGIVEVGDVLHVLEVRRVADMLGAGAGILRIKCRNGWTSVVSQSGLRYFDCLDLDGKDAPDLVPVYVHTAASDLLPARASSLSAEAARKICPSCGKEQKQGSTFCAGCGGAAAPRMTVPLDAETELGPEPEPKQDPLVEAELVELQRLDDQLKEGLRTPETAAARQGTQPPRDAASGLCIATMEKGGAGHAPHSTTEGGAVGGNRGDRAHARVVEETLSAPALRKAEEREGHPAEVEARAAAAFADGETDGSALELTSVAVEAPPMLPRSEHE